MRSNGANGGDTNKQFIGNFNIEDEYMDKSNNDLRR